MRVPSFSRVVSPHSFGDPTDEQAADFSLPCRALLPVTGTLQTTTTTTAANCAVCFPHCTPTVCLMATRDIQIGEELTRPADDAADEEAHEGGDGDEDEDEDDDAEEEDGEGGDDQKAEGEEEEDDDEDNDDDDDDDDEDDEDEDEDVEDEDEDEDKAEANGGATKHRSKAKLSNRVSGPGSLPPAKKPRARLPNERK